MWWLRLSGRFMSTNELRELMLPREVLEASNTQEFLRFWVADGHDYVTMNLAGFEDNTDEAYLWGSILADIAWHAVNGMQQDDPSRGSKKQMFRDILKGYKERLKDKPNLTGSMREKSNAH